MSESGLPFIIIMVLGVVAFVVFNRWSENQRQNSLSKNKTQSRTRSTYTTKPKKSKSKLTKKVKNDGDITSDQVTLVTHYISARDEFVGFVEVLDGHHSTEDDIKANKDEGGLFKSWQFLGFGDRYDANQRSSDFSHLAQQFKAESQNIISEFREQGWAIEQSPTSSKNDVYHLSR